MSADLPEWAEKWLRGTCGCGARTCLVIDMTGQGHTACSASGWTVEKCRFADEPPAAQADLTDLP